jgi:hypothetical protein
VIALLLSFTAPLHAQDHAHDGRRPRSPADDREPHCRIVCTPALSLMPALLRTHLRGGPLVRSDATNAVRRLPSSSAMEIIVAVAAPTAVPRVSVFGSVQWLPNASAQRNPFTLYTASELGEQVRANAPTATAGVSVSLITASATSGWLDVAGNVGDLFSQAARPGDASAYTHKLDLELATHLHAFDWIPARTYLHRASLFGILDYIATGLPREGDEVPLGRRFLSDARPLALIAGISFPLTPSAR